MHAEICLICGGTGKYCNKECHGCNGRGWVEVSDRYIPYPPYNPWYPYTIKYEYTCSFNKMEE